MPEVSSDRIGGLEAMHGWQIPESVEFNGLDLDAFSGTIHFGGGNTAIYVRFHLAEGWHDCAITHRRWSTILPATVQIDEMFYKDVLVTAIYGQIGTNETFVQYIVRGLLLGLDGESVLSVKFLASAT